MTAVDAARRCPPSEVLAAFVDAKLDRARVVELTAHVAGCAECRLVVETIAELQAEEAAPQETEEPRSASTSRWWLAIAAAVVLALILAPYARTLLHERRRERAMRELADTAASTDRTVTARLSGFRWSPRKPVYRSGGDSQPVSPEQLMVEGKADAVLTVAEHDTSAAATHDSGIADLLAGETPAAIAALNRAAHDAPNNARYWSDLAAALLQAAKAPEALVAAERALNVDPQSAEAMFNRALAIERLRPKNEAIAAWRQYLAHDSASPWAAEARKSIERLEQQP